MLHSRSFIPPSPIRGNSQVEPKIFLSEWFVISACCEHAHSVTIGHTAFGNFGAEVFLVVVIVILRIRNFPGCCEERMYVCMYICMYLGMTGFAAYFARMFKSFSEHTYLGT